MTTTNRFEQFTDEELEALYVRQQGDFIGKPSFPDPAENPLHQELVAERDWRKAKQKWNPQFGEVCDGGNAAALYLADGLCLWVSAMDNSRVVSKATGPYRGKPIVLPTIYEAEAAKAAIWYVRHQVYQDPPAAEDVPSA